MKPNPMVLPSTRPKIGFFDLRMETVKSLKTLAVTLEYNLLFSNCCAYGRVKLLRSFPEVKCPPLPLTTIYLIS